MATRRTFLHTLGAVAAVRSTTAAEGQAMTGQAGDPLGVRDQFPAVVSRLYLNAAYIAPVPRPVAPPAAPLTTRSVSGRFRSARC